MIFSDFYMLNQLATMTLGGNFINNWNGTYIAIPQNGTVPNLGSGLTSGNVPMLKNDALPQPIQDLLQSSGFIYIFVSTSYPILYVGMTVGDMMTGLFNSGRISHHVRKLLAAGGGGTSHTGGWIGHAVERYNNFVTAVDRGDTTIENAASYLSSDWYFAFAKCANPKKYEGSVLDRMAPLVHERWGNVTILNRAGVNRESVEIELPLNLGHIMGEKDTQKNEPRTEDPMVNHQIDQLPEAEQSGQPMELPETAHSVEQALEAEQPRWVVDPLGGKEHIDQIDPAEGGGDPDSWDEELDNDVKNGVFPNKRSGNWSVLPSSNEGCAEKLLVDIRNTAEIIPLLN